MEKPRSKVASVRLKMNTLIVAWSVALLASCATTPLGKELCHTGYGAPLTMDWRSAIRNWFHDQLEDPFSAQYEFTQPKKGYAHTPPSEGEKLVVGYKVIAQINAKNTYGTTQVSGHISLFLGITPSHTFLDPPWPRLSTHLKVASPLIREASVTPKSINRRAKKLISASTLGSQEVKPVS
jgi:hypothetical protein